MAQEKFLKVIIGKDIARTSSLVIGGSTDNIAEGEVAVLNKYKQLMTTSTDTYADSDSIYIVEGLGDTYDYVTPDGTSITGVRKLLYSDKIDGNAVSVFSANTYTAAAEQVDTISFGTLTPTIDEEYVVKIVYTDMEERPGQVTKTYRVIATTTTLADLYAAFVSEINKDSNRRVVASGGSTNLVLTALAYDDNETVDSINEYKQVTFKTFLYSDNFASDASITNTTRPTQGVGTWKLVRDEEKWSQGNEGFTNRIHFPILTPTFRTVKDETYDVIVINHKNWFTAANRQEKQVDITTKIFLATPSTTSTENQANEIETILNSWMASIPQPKANITLTNPPS